MTSDSPQQFALRFIHNLYGQLGIEEGETIELTPEVFRSFLADAYRQGGLDVLVEINEVIPKPDPLLN